MFRRIRFLSVAVQMLSLTSTHQHAPEQISVQLTDKVNADVFWTDCFAFTKVGAAAKAFFIHFVHHQHSTVIAFGLTLWQAVEV